MPGNKENLFETMGVADPNMILNVNVPETVRKQARAWRRGTWKRSHHLAREKFVRSCLCCRERCRPFFRNHDKSSLSMQSPFDHCRTEFGSPYPRLRSVCTETTVNGVMKMTSGSTEIGLDQQLQQLDYQQFYPQRQNPHPQTPEAHERKEHRIPKVCPNQITQGEYMQLNFPPKSSLTCFRNYRHQKAPLLRFLKSSPEMLEPREQAHKHRNTSSVSALGKTSKVAHQTQETGRRGCLSYCESGNSSRSDTAMILSTSLKNCFPLPSHHLLSQEKSCVECLTHCNNRKDASNNSGLLTSYPGSHAVTNPELFTKICEGKASFERHRRCQLPVDTPPYRGTSQCLGIPANENVNAHLIGPESARRKNNVADSIFVDSGGFEADGGFDSRRDDLHSTYCYQGRSQILDGTVDDITALSVAETVDFFLNMTSPLSGSDSEDSVDHSQIQSVWNIQEDTFL